MTRATIIDFYAWGDHFKLPPNVNMMKNRTKDEFVQTGTNIFMAVENAIKDHMPGRTIEQLDVLEFGCGVGRIVLPFFHKYGRPNACVDVMPKYIDYLQEVVPGARPSQCGFEPPLSFADESFDVVYSISVLAHMTPEDGDKWLREMARILRPGGLALVSTSSRLAQHRLLAETDESSIRGKEWVEVTDDDLRREGVIFKGRHMKGVGGIYGLTIHDPAWVVENWSKVMPVVEVRMRAVPADLGLAQDLNIMRKP